MQLPDLEAGDILHYVGQEGFEQADRILLLISKPEEVTLPGSAIRCKYEFLHNEQVIIRNIEQLLVLRTCDVIRDGRIIWNHIPDSNKERLEKLKELCKEK